MSGEMVLNENSGDRSSLTTRNILLWSALAITWPFNYLLTIPALDFAPATGGITIQLLFAAIMAFLFIRPASGMQKQKINVPVFFISVLIPALALAGFFIFQSWKRSAFAPPGSNVAFLLSLVPLFVLMGATFLKRETFSWEKAIAVLAMLLGCIAIVANWESPSSFSPFVRFTTADITIAFASLSLAVFILTIGAIRNLSLVFLVASVAAVLFSIVSGQRVLPTDATVDAYAFFFIASLIGVFLPVVLLQKVLDRFAILKSTTALALLPVVVTLMILVEQGFGLSYMPTPFLWTPVFAGAIVLIIGVIAVWRS